MQEAQAQVEEINGVEYKVDENDVRYVEREGFRITRDTFGGQLNGITFHTQEWLDLNKAIEKFGPERVLAALNGDIATSIKNRVRNGNPNPKEPYFKTWYTKTLASDPCVFSVDDAEKFVPGERELSSSGLLTMAKQQLREASKATDPVKAKEFKAKAREYMALALEKQDLEEAQQALLEA